MNTNARHFLSAAGLGLLSFTFFSSVLSGLSAMPTLVGFALLAAYGAIEIAVLSYAAPRVHVRRTEIAAAPSSKASVLVAFPITARNAAYARAA